MITIFDILMAIGFVYGLDYFGKRLLQPYQHKGLKWK